MNVVGERNYRSKLKLDVLAGDIRFSRRQFIYMHGFTCMVKPNNNSLSYFHISDSILCSLSDYDAESIKYSSDICIKHADKTDANLCCFLALALCQTSSLSHELALWHCKWSQHQGPSNFSCIKKKL